jgi:hypothetical protein
MQQLEPEPLVHIGPGLDNFATVVARRIIAVIAKTGPAYTICYLSIITNS